MLSTRKVSITLAQAPLLRSAGLVILVCLLFSSGCGGNDPEVSSVPDPGGTPDQGITTDLGSDPGAQDPGSGSEISSDEGTDEAAAVGDVSQETDSDSPDTTTGQDATGAGFFSKACVNTPDCNIPCAAGPCIGGQCNFTPKPGVCLVDASDEEVRCVEAGVISDESSCLLCNPQHNGMGWSGALLTTGFEPADDTPFDLIDATFSGVKWHLSTRRSFSGSYSLYSGDEQSASYGVEAHVRTEATTNTVNLPEGYPWLGFALWMETEETLGYDHLLVELLHKSSLEVIATLLDTDVLHSTTQGRWLPMSVDLSEYAGQEVRIRFAFDTNDSKINGFEGAYIDEIRVWTGCCGSDTDCAFSNPCKVGSCPGMGEACTVEEVSDCCLLDTGCDDNNACTIDSCPEFGGGCFNTEVEGCCLTDSDCDDDDECTEDLCPVEGGECHYTQLCCESDGDCLSSNACLVGTCSDQSCSFEDVCCHSGADCNDNDPCTYDICQEDGACTHSYKNLAGCCSPEPYNEELEDSEHGFTFINDDSTVGWHWVTNLKAVSGVGSLYYGNPTAMNYNSGSFSENSGTALSPQIFLNDGVDVVLSAKIWMDTESSSYYDKLSIHVQFEDENEAIQELLLWTKASNFSQETWNTVSIPMHAFAGYTVRIKFTFDTIDGTVNDTEGAYVDDIKFASTCTGVECNSGSDCDDGINGTVEICDGGTCLYVINADSNSAQCSTNTDCTDGDFCTIDTCEGGFCEYADSPFCFF